MSLMFQGNNIDVPIYNLSFILERLANLMQDEFVTRLKYLTTVRILTQNEAGALLKITDIPSLIIMPVGEMHTVGPAANTARQIYQIKMLLVAQSVDPNKYRVKLTQRNVFDLTQKIRELLYANKRLDKKMFEMRNTFIVRDVDVLFSGAGMYNGREINIEYTSLEAYVGESNSQRQLELPQGMDPAIISF